MAVTNITISQNNVYSGSTLMPIHSPLVFIATATFTGTAPDEMQAKIYDTTPTLLVTYRAVYLDDPTSTTRRFAFIANDALKSLMSDFNDNDPQLIETLQEADNMQRRLTLIFSEDVDSASQAVRPAHGARQFGESPNLTDVYSNEEKTFYGLKDGFCYVYFFAAPSANVTITDDGVVKGVFGTTNVGYYKYKTTCDVDKVINFNDGVGSYNQNVKIVDECSTGILLKFLDHNGHYRFYPFNQFYETKDNAELIGVTDEFITNILTAQTNSKSIGYNTKRTVLLTADNVRTDALEILSEIYSSPRVYAKIGTTDTAQDWVEVTVKGDGIVKRRKYNSGRVDLTMTYPEHFNIKMI